MTPMNGAGWGRSRKSKVRKAHQKCSPIRIGFTGLIHDYKKYTCGDGRPDRQTHPGCQTLQEVETANLPAVSKRVDKLTDRMIGFVKDSGVEPSKILNWLNRRLSRFSRNFMNAGPAGWRKMRLRQEIVEDFARKLRKLSAENEAGINKELADAEKTTNIDEYTVVETTSSFTETNLNAASQDLHRSKRGTI